MKRILCVLVLIALPLAADETPDAGQQPADAGRSPGESVTRTPGATLLNDELGEAVRLAVSKVSQSVVRLRIVGGEQTIEGETVSSQVTTGIVVSADGEILTSQFALDGSPQAVLAQDADGRNVSATIVATDHIRRIVLLRAAEGRWVPATAAAADAVRIGQWTIAAGRFYAADQCNLSVGILSAINRVHGLALQTDAKISPVNYGGPLINLNGDMLGILVPLSPRGQGSASSGVEWYDSGIGFAIPMADALRTADRLRPGKDLRPGRLGLSLKTSSPFDPELRVDRVALDGPADKAGLKSGDRIMAVAGRPVDRAAVLEEVVARSYAGESLELDVQRGEERITARLDLVEQLPTPEPGYLGLLTVRRAGDQEAQGVPDVAAIARMLQSRREQPGDKPAEPVVPAEEESKSEFLSLLVVDDSPAARAGLPHAIELLRIKGESVTTARALRSALSDLRPGLKVAVEYRLSGSTDVKNVDIEASALPASVPVLSDALLDLLQVSAAVAGPDDEMQRKEIPFEDQGKMIVFAAKDQDDVRPGIVMLVSTHEATEDDILRQWQPYLQSRRLIAVMPKNPEGTALTADDIPLILASLQAAGTEFKADLQRIVVVADRGDAELAWQLTTSGPTPIRGLALTSGWLPLARIRTAESAGLSVMLPASADNAQARALLSQNADALRTAGFRVMREDAGNMIARIADWSLFLRAM